MLKRQFSTNVNKSGNKVKFTSPFNLVKSTKKKTQQQSILISNMTSIVNRLLWLDFFEGVFRIFLGVAWNNYIHEQIK